MTTLYSIDYREISEAVARRIEAVKGMIKEIETSTNVKVFFDDSVRDIIVTRTIDNIIDELHIVFYYNKGYEYPDVDTLRAKLRHMFEYEDQFYDALKDEIKKMYKSRLTAEGSLLDSRMCLLTSALKKLNEEEEEKNV